MTASEEKAYIMGERAAWNMMLQHCIGNIGGELKTIATLISEREAAIAQLREICEAFGDNDWEEDLYLADIIEKHLGKYLYAEETV